MSEENKTRPSYYRISSSRKTAIEAIDYIESHDMSFAEGNVVKYLTRYKFKNGLEDLKKAKWYLDHILELELQRAAEKTSE
jgi:hypothetical protein